jgi:ABC-2 type transport system permease protein
MPVVIAPQLLLCGIIVPRDVSTGLAAVDQQLCCPPATLSRHCSRSCAYPDLTAIALRDIVVVIGFAVIAMCLAAATLRRRTP